MPTKSKKRPNGKAAAVPYPGQLIYTEREVAGLLGKGGQPLSRATMYRMREKQLIAYTRLYPGGPVRYLPEHIAAYQEYLRAHAHAATEKARA